MENPISKFGKSGIAGMDTCYGAMYLGETSFGSTVVQISRNTYQTVSYYAMPNHLYMVLDWFASLPPAG